MIDICCFLSSILYQTYKKGFTNISQSLLNQALWGFHEICRGFHEGFTEAP